MVSPSIMQAIEDPCQIRFLSHFAANEIQLVQGVEHIVRVVPAKHTNMMPPIQVHAIVRGVPAKTNQHVLSIQSVHAYTNMILKPL